MKQKTNKQTDPRIVRTRQLLKDALFELLQKEGADQITVNKLTERATINRVTFYLHYRDIPDLMENIAGEMIEEIRTILYKAKNNNSDLVIDAEQALVNLLTHIAENAKFYKSVLATQNIPIFTEKLLALLSDLISDLVTDLLDENKNSSLSSFGDMQEEIVIWYGSSALIGVIIFWLRNDMPYSPSYLAKQFIMLTPSR